MRKLDRAAVAAPPCLGRYKHGQDNWNAVDHSERQQIRDALERMQGRRCAYCEGPLDELGQHIEHFRSRDRHSTLTFAWTNLYWSCDRHDSCGRYKDHDARPYVPDDLIDPCFDDPDRFFRFHSDGTIAVRHDLPAADRRRAVETLRVFNLDPGHGRLRSMRQRVAEAYQAVEMGILDALIDCSEAERREFIEDEIARTADQPFSTVIRHFFETVL